MCLPLSYNFTVPVVMITAVGTPVPGCPRALQEQRPYKTLVGAIHESPAKLFVTES